MGFMLLGSILIKWNSNLGFADAMKRQEQKGNLNFYGIRHESAAAIAAYVYGKLTGKPAACFTVANLDLLKVITNVSLI